MRVLVDGEPHPLLNASPVGVAAIIAEIDSILEHRGRGIQQIVINGEAWSMERLDAELASLRIAGVDTLDVRTESMQVLIEQSLVEVENVIDELPAACHSFAALLSSTERDIALRDYESFVEIWGELFERHRETVDSLGVKASTVLIEGVPLDAWQIRAWKLIEQGSELATGGDAVGLADLLTYELLPYAEAEALVLEQLRRLTRAQASG